MYYTNVITDPENALLNAQIKENALLRDHANKKAFLLNGGKHITTIRLEKDLPIQKDLHCQKDDKYKKKSVVAKENKKKRLSVKWIFSFHLKLKMYLHGPVETLLRKEEEVPVHRLLCTVETIKEDVVNVQFFWPRVIQELFSGGAEGRRPEIK
jgi:hypothetical protein